MGKLGNWECEPGSSGDKAYPRQRIRTNASNKIVRFHEEQTGPSQADKYLVKVLLSQKLRTNRFRRI
jgi:hypothetical protein